MYEVLAGNRVRKMPEMEKPSDTYSGLSDSSNEWKEDWRKYNEELAKQPIYEISGSHNWKEGQLIEEGKDFEIKEMQWGSGTYVDYKRVAIPSVTNEEDELWVELVTEIDRFNDSELLYKYLKQHFTISRKPSL